MKKKPNEAKTVTPRDTAVIYNYAEVTALIDILLEKKLITKEDLGNAIDKRGEDIKELAKKLGAEPEPLEERPNYFG